LKGGFIGDGFQREGEETAGVDDADRLVPPVIGGGGREYPFGILAGWAEAERLAGPDLLPEALFFFFFFSSFPFLFSISFIDFAY
jgi:hypothetical protein